MSETISIRLNGSTNRVEALLAKLRGLPEVDAVIELDLDLPPADSPPTARGSDALARVGVARHRDVRVGVEGERGYAHVRGLLEVLAARSDIVLEWLDEG